MDFSIFRLFVFVCFGGTLCIPAVLLESVQAQENESRNINVWDRNNRNTIPREGRVGDEEWARRLSASFQKDFDPETKQQGQVLKNYGIFIGIVVVIVGSFVGWQMWRQNLRIKEVSDPSFLVNELISAHQLSEQEKRLMQELSEKNSLSSPLKLFVEPKYLLDAWQSGTFASSQSTIRQLLSKLFDIVKV